MLAALNPHARDARIRFVDSTHTYYVDGQALDLSVTGFIKRWFRKFDADDVIGKMKRFGTFFAKYGNQTAEEVKRGWEENRDRAASMGTRLHAYIESYYNGEPLPPARETADLEVEIGYFYNFVRDHPGLVPFRSEWCIYDEKHRLAGCIDMAFWVGPGKIAIFDWKRSKEIQGSSKYGKGLGPLGRLDDCNLNTYALQLSTYRYIIEHNYGLQVTETKLVVLHPNNPNYVVIPTRNLQAEVEALFAQRAADVHLT